MCRFVDITQHEQCTMVLHGLSSSTAMNVFISRALDSSALNGSAAAPIPAICSLDSCCIAVCQLDTKFDRSAAIDVD